MVLPAPNGDAGSAPHSLIWQTRALCLLARAPQNWHDRWWHQPVPATQGDCRWLPALWCRHGQILAAYPYFFQQLVFRFLGTHKCFCSFCGRMCQRNGPPPSTFLPGPRTGLSPKPLQLCELMLGEEETLAVADDLPQPQGLSLGLLGLSGVRALGCFGTCEGPEARVGTLLCQWWRRVFLAVPGASTTP